MKHSKRADNNKKASKRRRSEKRESQVVEHQVVTSSPSLRSDEGCGILQHERMDSIELYFQVDQPIQIQSISHGQQEENSQ